MFRINRPVGEILLSLSLLLVANPAPGAPPSGEGGPKQEGAPDFKIAYWYRRSDPLNTFRHRVYDIRKGQYTPAVDAWLRTIRERYPNYVAYVKDLRLDSRSGQDEEKQLATEIIQENLARGGPNRGFGLHDPNGIYGNADLGELLQPRVTQTQPPPFRLSETSRYIRGYGFVLAPGESRPPFSLGSPYPYQYPQPIPSQTSSPFPYPYVRPHP